MANADYMLNDENSEHFPEVLRERRRFYRETSKDQDFWIVPNPSFLDAMPDVKKKVRQPCVAVVIAASDHKRRRQDQTVGRISFLRNVIRFGGGVWCSTCSLCGGHYNLGRITRARLIPIAYKPTDGRQNVLNFYIRHGIGHCLSCFGLKPRL